MKTFLIAVLLILVEASTADGDTVEFKLGGYKIQVPLNRAIHVTRTKDLTDLHSPVPNLAELLTSAAHSAAAVSPPPAVLRTNRYPPDALRQTTYLEPHPLNTLFPSPKKTPHNYQVQRSLDYNPEQYSVSYYQRQQQSFNSQSHNKNNNFQSQRPDQPYYSVPQSLSIKKSDSSSANVEYLDHLVSSNNRYPATEPSSPHIRYPDTQYGNRHYHSYSPNHKYFFYSTPNPHHPQPLVNRPFAEYSAQENDLGQQSQSSRAIAPRATHRTFQQLPSRYELDEHVTLTAEPATVPVIGMTTAELVTSIIEQLVSTTERAIAATTPVVAMTTAELVRSTEQLISTTEPMTAAAKPLALELKTTTGSKLSTQVHDVLITTKDVTSVLASDVSTSTTDQVTWPFKYFISKTEPVRPVFDQDSKETVAELKLVPRHIPSENLVKMNIDETMFYEQTAVWSEPVTTLAQVVTPTIGNRKWEKGVMTMPKVATLAAEQITPQFEDFDFITNSQKLITTKTEDIFGTSIITSDTITPQVALPSPNMVQLALMALQSQSPLNPKRNPDTSEPAPVLMIPFQHIPTTFSTMTSFSTPPSIKNSSETDAESSTAAASIVLRNTPKDYAVSRSVTALSLRSTRATPATRAKLATRATPATLRAARATRVPCLRAAGGAGYKRRRTGAARRTSTRRRIGAGGKQRERPERRAAHRDVTRISRLTKQHSNNLNKQ